MVDAQSKPKRRRGPRFWILLALAGLALAAAACFAVVSLTREASQIPVRTRLTRDAETVAAAASQVAATPPMPVSVVPAPTSLSLDLTGAQPQGTSPGEPDEWIELTNAGQAAVRLDGWSLASDLAGRLVYRFPDAVIAPGQVCRVYTALEPAGECAFSAGSAVPLWDDAGDCVHLHGPDGLRVSSWCWP